jgi:hypothetical protein
VYYLRRNGRLRDAGVAIGIEVGERTIIMNMNNSSSEEPQVAAVEKKPYAKPGFRYEKVFVTSALTCTKTGAEGNCTTGTLSAS